VNKRNGDSWQSRRFKSKESVKQSMSYTSEGSQRVKSASEQESAARMEREALLHSLREAISRARLTVNVLDNVHCALRQKTCSTAGAKKWIERENLSELLKFGPPGGES
jgi:hypothetical protein